MSKSEFFTVLSFFLFLLVAVVLAVWPSLALASDLDSPEKMSEYFDIAGAVVLIASAVANAFRSEKAGKVVGAVGAVVNFLALNWRPLYEGWKRGKDGR